MKMESKLILKPNSKIENENEIKNKKMRAYKCSCTQEQMYALNKVITTA